MRAVPIVAAQPASGRDHPVAGDDDGGVVGPAGLGDGPRRARPANRLGHLSIGRVCRAGCRAAPATPGLEDGAVQVDRKSSEVTRRAGDVGGNRPGAGEQTLALGGFGRGQDFSGGEFAAQPGDKTGLALAKADRADTGAGRSDENQPERARRGGIGDPRSPCPPLPYAAGVIPSAPAVSYSRLGAP